MQTLSLFQSVKDVRSQGVGSLSSADILWTREIGGSSDADARTFGHKNCGFFESYGVSARTRGREVESVLTFCGQGRMGQFFAILCGRLL